MFHQLSLGFYPSGSRHQVLSKNIISLATPLLLFHLCLAHCIHLPPLYTLHWKINPDRYPDQPILITQHSEANLHHFTISSEDIPTDGYVLPIVYFQVRIWCYLIDHILWLFIWKIYAKAEDRVKHVHMI